jgi:hypothetical protein
MEGHVLVVVNDVSLAPSGRDAHVVRTMLEMIAWLEHATTKFVTVILGGDYAWDHEVIGFLLETYPAAQLVLAGPRSASIATA